MRRQPWIPIKRQPFYLFIQKIETFIKIDTIFMPQQNKTKKKTEQQKKKKGLRVRPLKWGWLVEPECNVVARFHWPRKFRNANPSRSSCRLRMFVLPV